jgi:hypothetical protein
MFGWTTAHQAIERSVEVVLVGVAEGNPTLGFDRESSDAELR